MSTTTPWYLRIWPVGPIRRMIRKQRIKSNMALIDEAIAKRAFAYQQSHPQMSARMARRKAQTDIHKRLREKMQKV